jgi:hypothetical protein
MSSTIFQIEFSAEQLALVVRALSLIADEPDGVRATPEFTAPEVESATDMRDRLDSLAGEPADGDTPTFQSLAR